MNYIFARYSPTVLVCIFLLVASDAALANPKDTRVWTTKMQVLQGYVSAYSALDMPITVLPEQRTLHFIAGHYANPQSKKRVMMLTRQTRVSEDTNMAFSLGTTLEEQQGFVKDSIDRTLQTQIYGLTTLQHAFSEELSAEFSYSLFREKEQDIKHIFGFQGKWSF